MSTNKLSHLKEGEKIYLEVSRIYSEIDNEKELEFMTKNGYVFVSDEDTFYFPDELKQLANDGMPKQGDEVYIKTVGSDIWRKAKFIAFYDGKIVVDVGGLLWTTIWRLKPQKTELTLAEVEERLGLDKDSLIIKD